MLVLLRNMRSASTSNIHLNARLEQNKQQIAHKHKHMKQNPEFNVIFLNQ